MVYLVRVIETGQVGDLKHDVNEKFLEGNLKQSSHKNTGGHYASFINRHTGKLGN